MEGRQLDAGVALGNIAVDGCALRKIRRGEVRQRRGVTERIGAIVEGYKPETFRRVEPLHLCPLRPGAGMGIEIEVSHDETVVPLCRHMNTQLRESARNPQFATDKP